MPQTAPLSLSGGVSSGGAQNAVSASPGGLAQTLAGVIFTGTANAVNSGTSPITMIPTGVGTLTLPANYLVAGKTIRIKAMGNCTTAASPGTILFTLAVGASTLLTTAATTPAISSAGLFTLEAFITCRAVGASGSLASSLTVDFNINTLSVNFLGSAANGGVTTDTTASNAITLTSTNSIASGVSLNVLTFTAEVLN